MLTVGVMVMETEWGRVVMMLTVRVTVKVTVIVGVMLKEMVKMTMMNCVWTTLPLQLMW